MMPVTQAILEISDGLYLGKKTWLRPGEAIHVGRTAWADFTIAHDAEMADVHFRLECARDACRFRSLNDDAATFINGTPLDEGFLRNGDSVVAGRTTFRVLVDGDPTPVPLVNGKAIHQLEAVTPAEPFGGGYVVTEGEADQERALQIVQRLARKVPLHLLVDTRRIDAEFHVDLATLPRLFESPTGATFSPALLSSGGSVEPLHLLERAWRTDSLVCIFSHQDGSDLLNHLRQIARGTADSESPGRGLIACWWPGVLRALFAQDPSFVDSLMSKIDGIFLESNETGGWIAWTTPKLSECAGSLDLSSRPSEEGVPSS